VDQLNIFLTMEQWADQAAIEAHKIRSHFNEFVKLFKAASLKSLKFKSFRFLIVPFKSVYRFKELKGSDPLSALKRERGQTPFTL
jgi:hypothetical protein